MICLKMAGHLYYTNYTYCKNSMYVILITVYITVWLNAILNQYLNKFCLQCLIYFRIILSHVLRWMLYIFYRLDRSEHTIHLQMQENFSTSANLSPGDPSPNRCACHGMNEWMNEQESLCIRLPPRFQSPGNKSDHVKTERPRSWTSSACW